MVDRQKLSNRLNALEDYLTEIRALAALPREKFIREPSFHHLAERYLHLACEAVLDMANHVISEEGYRQPGTNEESITVLEEEGILSPELAERLRRWMGFRNVLVHLYLEIDHGRVYDAMTEDLGDLEEFASRISTFL